MPHRLRITERQIISAYPSIDALTALDIEDMRQAIESFRILDRMTGEELEAYYATKERWERALIFVEPSAGQLGGDGRQGVAPR